MMILPRTYWGQLMEMVPISWRSISKWRILVMRSEMMKIFDMMSCLRREMISDCFFFSTASMSNFCVQASSSYLRKRESICNPQKRKLPCLTKLLESMTMIAWRTSIGKARSLSSLCRLTLSLSNLYSNGLRAPPWRQVHGDLGYVIIKPRDMEPFYVVANSNGYWQIKVIGNPVFKSCSFSKGPDASGSMNDEKVGDTFASLSELLKNKSPHFAATINSHVCPWNKAWSMSR